MTDPNAVPGGGAYLVNDTNSVGSGGVVILTYRGLSGSGTAGAYVKSASPVRDAADVVFYQPVVVDITDGTTSPAPSRAINDASVALTVDGVAPAFTKVRTGDTIHVQQTGTPNWATGLHTNNLVFTDAAGTNYNYTWTWTVMGGVNGVAGADTTNSPTVVTLTGQAAGAVNLSLPGWRLKPWQSYMEAGENNSGWAEAQLEGLHSPNVASLAGTNGPGYFIWNNLWDIRYDSGGGAGGEWTYDLGDWTGFGIGAAEPSYRIIFAGVNTKTETAAADIVGWLVFPQAGRYVMYANSDDGLRVLSPQGNLFGKLGTSLVTADVGRGMTGPSVFTVTGGTYYQVNIPTPGAYPFRMVYFNGGTGGGLEWSIFQNMPDGSVRQVPINDPNTPGSIKAYQALSAGDSWAPYVSFMNPVLGQPDTLVYQPQVVELTDGGGKTVNAGSIVLKVDGNVVSPTVTSPSAGVTRIVWNHPTQLMATGLHTNLLTYTDSSSATYSNWYPYNVVGPAVAIVPIPATLSVPTSQVDHTKPGFRVKSYQTTAAHNNTVDFTERDFLGLNGANIADQTGAGGTGYFTWNDGVDFFSNRGANAASGEYRLQNLFSSFGIVQNGGTTESNNCALMFGGWMEFPTAGTYTMTVNSDDGFKITFPFGGNAFNESGIQVANINAGRGNSGGNANPFAGSSTAGTFTIPAAGAYPIRMVWENGGGGWTSNGPCSAIVRTAPCSACWSAIPTSRTPSRSIKRSTPIRPRSWRPSRRLTCETVRPRRCLTSARLAVLKPLSIPWTSSPYCRMAARPSIRPRCSCRSMVMCSRLRSPTAAASAHCSASPPTACGLPANTVRCWSPSRITWARPTPITSAMPRLPSGGRSMAGSIARGPMPPSLASASAPIRSIRPTPIRV